MFTEQWQIMYILNSMLVHYSVALGNYCEELAWHDETKNGRAERHWISSTPPPQRQASFSLPLLLQGVLILNPILKVVEYVVWVSVGALTVCGVWLLSCDKNPFWSPILLTSVSYFSCLLGHNSWSRAKDSPGWNLLTNQHNQVQSTPITFCIDLE